MPQGWQDRSMDSGDTVGFKADLGKPRFSLIPPKVIREVAAVFTYGAAKYGDHNWRDGMKWNRQMDGALRHINAFSDGEDKDPESGYSHIAHAIACLMMLGDYQHGAPVYDALDDRFKLPPIPFARDGGGAAQEAPLAPTEAPPKREGPDINGIFVGDWVRFGAHFGHVVAFDLCEDKQNVLVQLGSESDCRSDRIYFVGQKYPQNFTPVAGTKYYWGTAGEQDSHIPKKAEGEPV
jgi:hypothetical protein